MIKKQQCIFPHPFYLSGLPVRGKRPKVFRPKLLGEKILPNIGMIMYDIFWLKYAIYLTISKGINYENQNYLFFWAEDSKGIHAEDGVLYYSLLSQLNAIEEKGAYIGVGSTQRFWARWIFKSDWSKVIIDEFLNYINNPVLYESTSFIDKVFSSDFKTDCKRQNVDIYSIISQIFNQSENNFIEGIILSFVNTLANMFYRNKRLIENHKARARVLLNS